MQQDSGPRKAARPPAKAAAATLQTGDPTAAISSVAYSLYEARGCVDGHALEDWLEAEARVGQGVAAVPARQAAVA